MNLNEATRRENRIRHVAQRAMHGYDALPAPERIELLLSVAEVLPETQAEAARHAAFCLQESEAQQLKFTQLLATPAT